MRHREITRGSGASNIFTIECQSITKTSDLLSHPRHRHCRPSRSLLRRHRHPETLSGVFVRELFQPPGWPFRPGTPRSGGRYPRPLIAPTYGPQRTLRCQGSEYRPSPDEHHCRSRSSLTTRESSLLHCPWQLELPPFGGWLRCWCWCWQRSTEAAPLLMSMVPRRLSMGPVQCEVKVGADEVPPADDVGMPQAAAPLAGGSHIHLSVSRCHFVSSLQHLVSQR
mmetsp:Transcript_48582/g.103903  ORF Transcript_48582/g.103903 Transcript_48582/m.103903 type:complete len:224 (+) Transcript_48582:66-737(+)